mmetsp:Transcript_26081/g.78593  ORF Transcript_26081/g.78593 Transcript_26081/m.78593 type:complete len:214 (-) Transcript_26081:651-1292(-)
MPRRLVMLVMGVAGRVLSRRRARRLVRRVLVRGLVRRILARRLVRRLARRVLARRLARRRRFPPPPRFLSVCVSNMSAPMQIEAPLSQIAAAPVLLGGAPLGIPMVGVFAAVELDWLPVLRARGALVPAAPVLLPPRPSAPPVRVPGRAVEALVPRRRRGRVVGTVPSTLLLRPHRLVRRRAAQTCHVGLNLAESMLDVALGGVEGAWRALDD